MNIMLFSDIPPCENYTAGIVLNTMCDFLLEAGHEVCCFTVKDKAVGAEIPRDKLDRMKFANIEKPRENWGHTALKGLGSFIGNNATAVMKLPSIARQAGQFAKENDVQLVWSVVQGQTMIKLTEPVAKYAGVPYVIQVWDPPEWWMMDNKFDKYTTASVMKAFGRALKNSQHCIAASWAMAEDYSRRYECNATPVIRGFSPERVIAKGEKHEDEFIIALSGQIYASDEFTMFLRALDLMNWQFEEKKIRVRLYGRYFHLYFSEPARLEIRGWMNQEELLPELADADLLYCPYWFSERFCMPATLSFPSKLSTYLKTAVPVIIHGPEYASPRRYIAEHGAGYICDTLDPEGIKNTLTFIMSQPAESRQAVGEHGYYAFTQTLTTAHMKKAFFKALGIA